MEDRSRGSAVSQLRLLARGGGIQPLDNSGPNRVRLLSYIRRVDAVAAQSVLHLRRRHLCAKRNSCTVRSRRCATFDTTSHSCGLIYRKCRGFSVGTLLGVFGRVYIRRLPPHNLGLCRRSGRPYKRTGTRGRSRGGYGICVDARRARKLDGRRKSRVSRIGV